MDIQEILKMYNEDSLTLVEIGSKLGTSKSSLSRLLSNNGYVFNKALKQYIHETVNNVSRETINTGNNETINTGNKETIKQGNSKKVKTVKCTFELPEQLHRELKAKCALEGYKMVDYVRELLEKAIK